MAKKKSTASKRDNATVAKPSGTTHQRKWRGSDPSDQEWLAAKKTRTKDKQVTVTGKKTNTRKGIQSQADTDDERSSDEVNNSEEELDSGTEREEACQSGAESPVSWSSFAAKSPPYLEFCQDEDLPDVSAPGMLNIKNESTRDMLTIFSEIVKVKFKQVNVVHSMGTGNPWVQGYGSGYRFVYLQKTHTCGPRVTGIALFGMPHFLQMILTLR
jgi:hypothetical protein